MTVPFRGAAALTCGVLATVTFLLSGSAAHAQAQVTFSGGNGTPLVINLNNPLTYTVTAPNTYAGPFVFLFVGAAPNPFFLDFSATSNITYSVNGGAATTFDFARNGYIGNQQGPTDLELAGISGPSGLFVGDIVTLTAGTLTTSQNISGLPANGTFTTFIADQFGNRLSGDGVSAAAAVPEPSEWAIMGMLGTGVCGLMVRARRRKAASAA